LKEREEVVRVVRGDGQPGRIRIATGEDRRDRVLGESVDAAGPAEPGGVPRESGEGGVADRIDLPRWVEERRCRQLVEDHHDDRCLAFDRDGEVRLRVAAREQQLCDRGVERERGREHERRDGERGHEHPHDTKAGEGDAGESAQCEGGRQQHSAAHVGEARERREHGGGDERDDPAQVEGAAQRTTQPSEDLFQQPRCSRRGDQQRRDQQDDVSRCCAVRHQKRRVASQQVEQGLGDGEREQGEELEASGERAVQAPSALRHATSDALNCAASNLG
jgi:hypothetical protein